MCFNQENMGVKKKAKTLKELLWGQNSQRNSELAKQK